MGQTARLAAAAAVAHPLPCTSSYKVRACSAAKLRCTPAFAGNASRTRKKSEAAGSASSSGEDIVPASSSSFCSCSPRLNLAEEIRGACRQLRADKEEIMVAGYCERLQAREERVQTSYLSGLLCAASSECWSRDCFLVKK